MIQGKKTNPSEMMILCWILFGGSSDLMAKRMELSAIVLNSLSSKALGKGINPFPLSGIGKQMAVMLTKTPTL